VAENLGHIKAVATMTGRNLDPYIGRAFFADGVATIVSGSGGGTGVTTYAENIGVMAVTKIYSSLVFLIAAVVAIVLGFSPMFGALVLSIPQPVLGGMAIVLFGLIATTGARIWVENRVDFTDNKNFITAAVALTLGAGNLAITQGDFSIGGIGTACIGALLVYQSSTSSGWARRHRPRPLPQRRPRSNETAARRRPFSLWRESRARSVRAACPELAVAASPRPGMM